MPRPQSHKLFCAGGPQCFAESWWLCWLQQNGEFHSRNTISPWLLGKWASHPSEEQLSPLVCKWSYCYRDWIWCSFKKGISPELEYAFYTYLHCKLKFKEACDGKMNFLADSAMSESHNMCVLLDRQSLNWQDEQSSVCLLYGCYFYEQKKLSVCLRSLHHGSGALYAR